MQNDAAVAANAAVDSASSIAQQMQAGAARAADADADSDGAGALAQKVLSGEVGSVDSLDGTETDGGDAIQVRRHPGANLVSFSKSSRFFMLCMLHCSSPWSCVQRGYLH